MKISKLFEKVRREVIDKNTKNTTESKPSYKIWNCLCYMHCCKWLQSVYLPPFIFCLTSIICYCSLLDLICNLVWLWRCYLCIMGKNSLAEPIFLQVGYELRIFLHLDQLLYQSSQLVLLEGELLDS